MSKLLKNQNLTVSIRSYTFKTVNHELETDSVRTTITTDHPYITHNNSVFPTSFINLYPITSPSLAEMASTFIRVFFFCIHVNIELCFSWPRQGHWTTPSQQQPASWLGWSWMRNHPTAGAHWFSFNHALESIVCSSWMVRPT